MRRLTIDELLTYFQTHVRRAQIQIDERYRQRIEAALKTVLAERQQAGISVTFERTLIDRGERTVQSYALPFSLQRLLQTEIQEVSLEFQMLIEQEIPSPPETWLTKLRAMIRRRRDEVDPTTHTVTIRWIAGIAPMGTLSIDGIVIRQFDMDSRRIANHA